MTHDLDFEDDVAALIPGAGASRVSLFKYSQRPDSRDNDRAAFIPRAARRSRTLVFLIATQPREDPDRPDPGTRRAGTQLVGEQIVDHTEYRSRCEAAAGHSRTARSPRAEEPSPRTPCGRRDTHGPCAWPRSAVIRVWPSSVAVALCLAGPASGYATAADRRSHWG